MRMERTDYRLGDHHNTIGVFKGEKRKAYGFGDVESALKAVHVLEGRPLWAFFDNINGIVFRRSILWRVKQC